jgi:hypothetical protein
MVGQIISLPEGSPGMGILLGSPFEPPKRPPRAAFWASAKAMSKKA